MYETNYNQIKKINSKPFVLFIKIFLIYVFFEYFLLNITQNITYQYFIKFLGDFLIFAFFVYTFIRLKNIRFYKGQKILLVAMFFLVAAISTLKNQLTLQDLFLGLRVLFRYYIIFFLSYYYTIKKDDFKKVSDFIIKSLYVETVFFFVNYLIFDKINILGFSYLAIGIYLNVVFALVIFENKFSLRNISFLIILFVQAFLSTSRLAFVGIIIQSLIFVLFIWKKKAVIRVGAVLLIMLLGFILFNIEPINSQIINSDSYNKIKNTGLDPENNYRVYLLTHFTEQSVQNVNLIGDGPNRFGAKSFGSGFFYEDYLYQQGFDSRTIAYSADSHYTVLLMSYGFIGLILYYLMLLLLYADAQPNYKKFLMLYLSFIFIASFVLPVFSMRLSSFLIFAFFGLTHKN